MMSADSAFALPSSMWQIRTPSRCSVVTAADDIAPTLFATRAACLRQGSATGRTTTPASAISAFASAIVCSRKWKIEAASTASAPPIDDAVDEVLERADAPARDHRAR